MRSLQSQSFALLAEVEKKAVQSLKRANEVSLAQLRKAKLHLFPLGRPQERVLNPFYYLVRYDQAFLDALARRAEEGRALRPARRLTRPGPETVAAPKGGASGRGPARRAELQRGAAKG